MGKWIQISTPKRFNIPFGSCFTRLYEILSYINLEKLADTLAPGEGGQLIQMAQIHSHTKDGQESQQAMSNEMIQNLK